MEAKINLKTSKMGGMMNQLIDNLYEFYFNNRKGQYLVYLITFILSFGLMTLLEINSVQSQFNSVIIGFVSIFLCLIGLPSIFFSNVIFSTDKNTGKSRQADQIQRKETSKTTSEIEFSFLLTPDTLGIKKPVYEAKKKSRIIEQQDNEESQQACYKESDQPSTSQMHGRLELIGITQPVTICTKEMSLIHVFKLMLENDCNRIIVVESYPHPIPVGSISEKDICLHIIGKSRDPHRLSAANVMNTNILKVGNNSSISYCLNLMRNREWICVVDERGLICGAIDYSELLAYTQRRVSNDDYHKSNLFYENVKGEKGQEIKNREQ